ncbi:UDP-N-acetylglucosamine 2-epimerase [Flavobacterium cauense R2A-7]|uniref:UDP-N-acetylglucosamine 2-epimerase/UDP-hydrolysing UDP-N-acetyl-D-glucosamine 2-epimerase,TIGR03568 n=1 Tax=Flavobacterium cauense R2A-7 TaxID=1341154 RepID=V6S3G4_9FLAO|nr:UDP-N-acetylglucosamine 2-epimerase [Flavobacterium cauense]ESU20792.1 UDP-N-acetylglucosamine 2-epimerase [Flavobacterium cauense R2A-7]KGO82839.1 UDP-N-acetylglucosamine 2-epimerase [Flavobacterium cauense R2A-7]TWI12132.1 UDP-N-acetylglucosamine 2-epimerase/UDP-hydrolysing UDP-N-acetyl-D-glucosamine 2-epimerase,TIGR03568 [Flavobacterium cauense R2A-7]
MPKRKIAVVITARPSYSRVKTVLTSIQKHPELELQLIIAASALLDRYGSAVNYIEKDGFEIAARVFNVLEGENLTAAAKTTGIGILELSTVFDNLKPDIVVTVADRFETMATAIAASYMNIPLAHIQGGEVTGNIDEKVRHSITKLADYHFVASEGAKERVIKLGEDPAMVFNTGCPSIDLAKEIKSSTKLPFNPYEKYGGVGAQPDLSKGYLVVMQHPVTTEYKDSRKHIEATLEAVYKLNKPTLWFWPNVDAGADGTSTGIRAFREQHQLPQVHFFKNMEGKDFLELLKHSDCLIGNSSVGIRECAYLGVPVVNIGSRQNKRDRGNNVIDVDYCQDAIENAILQSSEKGVALSSSLYGNGNAGEEIASLLTTLPLQFHKTIMY